MPISVKPQARNAPWRASACSTALTKEPEALDPQEKGEQLLDHRRRGLPVERQQVDDGVQTVVHGDVPSQRDRLRHVLVDDGEQPCAPLPEAALHVGDGLGAWVGAEEPLACARGPRQQRALLVAAQRGERGHDPSSGASAPHSSRGRKALPTRSAPGSATSRTKPAAARTSTVGGWVNLAQP